MKFRAAYGAMPIRAGARPLNSAAAPSCRVIVKKASAIPAHRRASQQGAQYQTLLAAALSADPCVLCMGGDWT